MGEPREADAPPTTTVASPLDSDGCDEGEGLGAMVLEAEAEGALTVALGEGGVEVSVFGFARDMGQTLACTGLTSWRGGENLARWLYAERLSLAAPACLELGAGLGLCSIVVARHCQRVGRVVATDGDALSLAAMRAAQNCGTEQIAVRELRWGDADHISRLLAENDHGRPFDLVVAADVLYQAEHAAPLAATVHALLAPNGTFVLSFTRRGVDLDILLQEMAKRCLAHKDAPGLDAPPIPSTERLLVFTRAAGHRQMACLDDPEASTRASPGNDLL